MHAHFLAGRGYASPFIWLLVMVLLGAAAIRPLRGAEITDQQIVDTINKQVNFLLSQRSPEKNWEIQKTWSNSIFAGGETALTLYSLLYAGRCIEDDRLSAKSPELKPALQWLAKVRPTATYTAGLQANVFALVPDLQHHAEYRAALTCDRDYLLGAMGPTGGYYYGWLWQKPHATTYADGHEMNGWDSSNSQYGLLGAWAAWDVGTDFPTRYWSIVNDFWKKNQKNSGGWGYDGGRPESLAMTAAGVASLYITTDCVNAGIPQLEGRVDSNLEAGVAWINKNFKAGGDAYELYGCARVGLASGRKFFGTTDWYKAGVAAILAAQAADGHNDLFVLEGDACIRTAYTLLFLCRGRNPILFNKLEYHDATNPGHFYWNARPRDLANLTHQFGRAVEKDFNWHVVNLQVPPEQWLDAPVLLITGSKDPHFTPEDVAKLTTFINDGGIIFSTADGAAPAFTAAMKNYAAQVVDHKYEMREFPKEHDLYTLQSHITSHVPLLGMSNGVREVWIHSPGDLGAAWQRRALAQKDYWDLPANVYVYATGKYNSRAKMEDLIVQPASTTPLRTIHLARIDYSGNWDPEPGAWPRMAKLAQAQFKTDLKISNVKLVNLDAKKMKLAHITGTAAFTPSPEDTAALRQYLESGGTLLVDAAGGSTAFVDSVIKVVRQLFGQDSFENLPDDHPVRTGSMPDGVDIGNVTYRHSMLKKSGPPPLVGLKHQGRWVVVMSPLDMTSGLLGTRTWGINGYSPESSQAMARNMLLWSQAH